MEKGWRKERKKGLETAIFLCEPPARINANSLILLPLFLVFPPPSISRFYSPLLSSSLRSHLVVFLPRCALSAHCFHIICIFGFTFFKGSGRHITKKNQPPLDFFSPFSFFSRSCLTRLFFFTSHSRVVFLTDSMFAYLVNGNSACFWPAIF